MSGFKKVTIEAVIIGGKRRDGERLKIVRPEVVKVIGAERIADETWIVFFDVATPSGGEIWVLETVTAARVDDQIKELRASVEANRAILEDPEQHDEYELWGPEDIKGWERWIASIERDIARLEAENGVEYYANKTALEYLERIEEAGE